MTGRLRFHEYHRAYLDRVAADDETAMRERLAIACAAEAERFEQLAEHCYRQLVIHANINDEIAERHSRALTVATNKARVMQERAAALREVNRGN